MKCKWLVACVWVFLSPVLWPPSLCTYCLHPPMVTPLVKILVLAFMLADIGKKIKKLGPDWVLFKKEEIREKGGAESFSHRTSSFSNSAVPSWRSDSKRHETRQALYTVPFPSISFCLECSSWHHKDSHPKRGSFSCFGCNLWIIASEPRFKTKTINQLSLLLTLTLRVYLVSLREYDPRCQHKDEQLVFPSQKWMFAWTSWSK